MFANILVFIAGLTFIFFAVVLEIEGGSTWLAQGVGRVLPSILGSLLLCVSLGIIKFHY